MTSIPEQIIEKTSALLEKQGYYGTGLNEIVKESGAPKGSLYYYFPQGKEQIISETVLKASEITAGRIRAGLSGENDLAQVLYDFIMKIAENVEWSRFSAGSPLTAVAMETATTCERINLACRSAYAQLITAFQEKLFASGMPEAKAEQLAVFITASVEGGIILSRTNHNADPLRQIALQLKQFLQETK